MSQVKERGLDGLTEHEWELVDELADEEDGWFGEKLRAIHDGYHAEQEDGDGG